MSTYKSIELYQKKILPLEKRYRSF
ncbi:MAG TPA: hypothetical protein DDE71_08880 [Tenacibaculum sp.]|nr:hypothetical protein [Tenacibaculum sp.]